MFNVDIRTIPHGNQRYDTVGDWFWDHERKLLVIMVSDMGDWKKEALVAFHEFEEAVLCKSRNITEEQVDQFDFNFQGCDEPGNDPQAPYYHEHQAATQSEKHLADELGVDWDEYERVVNSL